MASSIYELIGRGIVRLVWFRFGQQLKVAGAVAVVLTLGAGYLLSRRQPPEG